MHGDDFVSVGNRAALKWFKEELLKTCEISTQVVGMGEGEAREGKVLIRIIRVDKDGCFFEADQRHAEIIVKQMGMVEAKASATLGEDAKPWEEEEDAVELSQPEASTYRGVAARAKYLASDRADLQFATK